ncbi:MAG: type II toxin-antitoxin system RatA family toxin [Pseudomonadota bacterium]
MPRLTEQLLIPHSADNLYELVRDIRRYPEFIRWIRRMRVSNEQGDGSATYSCVGEADVTFKGFDETFSTSVKGDADTRTIEVGLARGPFRHLKNRWQFDPRDDGKTRVHFFIDYEFKNPILGMLARTNSRLAVDKIMKAFRAEADRRFERV